MSSLEQGPCFGNVQVPPGGSAQGRQHYRYKGDVIETTTNKQPHSFGSKSPLAEKILKTDTTISPGAFG